jgi:opacity protein-like surface antigen
MVGIGYEPSSVHNVGLTLGYRYMAPFSDPSASGTDYQYSNHSVEVGAKFRF